MTLIDGTSNRLLAGKLLAEVPSWSVLLSIRPRDKTPDLFKLKLIRAVDKRKAILVKPNHRRIVDLTSED